MKKNETKKGFRPLSEAVRIKSANKKFKEAFESKRVSGLWSGVVEGVFPGASLKTKPLTFRSGVLRVACLSAELAKQLRLFASRLVYFLNAALGAVLVLRLEVEC